MLFKNYFEVPAQYFQEQFYYSAGGFESPAEQCRVHLVVRLILFSAGTSKRDSAYFELIFHLGQLLVGFNNLLLQGYFKINKFVH